VAHPGENRHLSGGFFQSNLNNLFLFVVVKVEAFSRFRVDDEGAARSGKFWLQKIPDQLAVGGLVNFKGAFWGEVASAVVPFIFLYVFALFVITYIPWLSLFLPRLLYGVR
jgi:hypothetical protein